MSQKGRTYFAAPAAGVCPPPLIANGQLLPASIATDSETSSVDVGTITHAGETAPSCADQ